jgi:hypothetical protein
VGVRADLDTEPRPPGNNTRFHIQSKLSANIITILHHGGKFLKICVLSHPFHFRTGI